MKMVIPRKPRHGMDRSVKVSVESGTAPSTDTGNKKTQCNKFELKQASKSYKSTMKKHYNKFKKFNVSRLRSLKTPNPKRYWQIINGKKSKFTQSKKISNDQELIQLDPTSCPQNQTGNN